MHSFNARLAADLAAVADVLPIEATRDGRWMLARHFPLPPGFNMAATRLLIGIPPLYPQAPPSAVYLAPDVRFHNRPLPNLYPGHGPTREWAWLCLWPRSWDPCRDSLVCFLDVIRAELSNH
ncbi:MAG: hypothetical protein AMXMBFR47_35800 [Planctomycetota bacterium]